MGKLLDLEGARYGAITVVRRSSKRIGKRARVCWDCECDCGARRVCTTENLTQGHHTSCGCLKADRARSLGREHITHGQSRTLTHNSWHAMRSRCFDSKHRFFKNYGGRGITPCPFIAASVLNIISVIGQRPSSRLTLDRIDNDEGYNCGSCPSCLSRGKQLNMRWSTRVEQAQNRRKKCPQQSTVTI